MLKIMSLFSFSERTKAIIKNNLLLSTYVLGNLHTIFWGNKTRVDWYLLVDYTRRIDFAVMYLTTSINFLILAYCLRFPKGIAKGTRTFILIVTILDLLHYILLSKRYLVTLKIGLAIVIFYIVRFIQKRHGKFKVGT